MDDKKIKRRPTPGSLHERWLMDSSDLDNITFLGPDTTTKSTKKEKKGKKEKKKN